MISSFSLLFLSVALTGVMLAPRVTAKVQIRGFPISVESSDQQFVVGIEVSVESGRNLRMDQVRQVSFMWQGIPDPGNYIAELQCAVNGKFEPAQPTTEVHLVPSRSRKKFEFNVGEMLRDTVVIRKQDYLSMPTEKGFAPGQYRIRIWFEPDQAVFTGENQSEWVYFSIKN